MGISIYESARRVAQIDIIPSGAKTKIANFVNMVEGFKTGLTGSVSELMERVFEETGLRKVLEHGSDKELSALENVAELINAASEYDNSVEEPSLVDYLQQIALFSDTDSYDDSQGSVALMTLHAAKGLEFEHVFIVGAEEGILPHERSVESDDELEEERRLLFVGMTRAKKGLNLSYARHRVVRGMMIRTIPSKFLYETGLMSKMDIQNSYEYDTSTGQSFYEESADPAFKAGDTVAHKIFGLGKVKEFLDMGDKSIIVVKFNSGQVKSLMLQYANLTRVNR